jgi:hypothetical protein
MNDLPVPKGEGDAWVRRFDAPAPSSKIHVWSTPPVLEIFPLLPTGLHLYTLNDKKEEYYSVAHIKDYQTSVMMNNLFRIIKENNNLDLLEESDDEEEFQNENNNKYLKQNIEYKMVCSYNTKFKKWAPYKTTDAPITIMKNNSIK